MILGLRPSCFLPDLQPVGANTIVHTIKRKYVLYLYCIQFFRLKYEVRSMIARDIPKVIKISYFILSYPLTNPTSYFLPPTPPLHDGYKIIIPQRVGGMCSIGLCF